ncbi:MAG: SH3 domain-containing protein [Candidatus Ventricola sp.]
MKKRMSALLLFAALCLCAACALAGDYGTAVVDAGNSNRVHLREEPSAEAKSLGLYFTGTQVECRSDPAGEWVDVKIGRERGYMKSRYLKTGNAADCVTPRFKTGTVTATNYGRLRKGPSTEYQFICNVSNGATVTIMGETDEHWYYVKAGKEIGFMSSGLVRIDGEMQSQPAATSTPVPSTTAAWKKAYRDWIAQNGQSEYRYGLIYVNRDGVPELAVDTRTEAGGCQILTYDQGRTSVLQTRRRGFTYIPGGNALCNADGSMDYYYDDVYTLENGAWKRVAYGEYYGYKGGWSEEQNRYICETYVWNGTQTTMEGYLQALARVYPQSVAQQPAFAYSHDEILAALK